MVNLIRVGPCITMEEGRIEQKYSICRLEVVVLD